MKRKGQWKKILCIGLVGTMVLGLTACGKKEGEQGGNGGQGGAATNANTAAAKEYVFKETPIELPISGDNVNLRTTKISGDKVYLFYDVYNWTDTSNDNDMKIVVMNKDGSDMQVVDMQMSMEEASGEVSGESAENQVTNDVNIPVIQPRTEDDGIAEDDLAEEYIPQTYEYTGLGSFEIAGDAIYGIKNYYKEDYSNPDKPEYTENTYICAWNTDGTMKWESVIEGLQTEESYSYVQTVVPMAEGKVAILLNGDKCEMINVSADGTIAERKELPETFMPMRESAGFFVNEPGVITCVYWNWDTTGSMWINKFDFNNGTAGEAVKMPDSMATGGYNALCNGGEVADVVYSSDSGIYGYNIGDAEPFQIMDFVNSDMATTSFNNVVMLSADKMLGFYYDSWNGTMGGGVFTKVDPADIPDKRVLMLAGNYIGWDVRRKVVEFNKSNELYRIMIKEYDVYNTMEDYSLGYTQLHNDILAGNMPDILLVDRNMSVDSYIAKGLLADVDKLIKEDPDLSQVEFMDNVFEAYRVDGTLYHVLPSFYARTLMGKTSVVGDKPTWTMEEFKQLVQNTPEGTEVIGELTRDQFLYQMMLFCGNDFVDVSTGKCTFDSPNFISMLEYAKTLPTELGEDYYGEDFWMTYESQYRENRTVLMNAYLSSARDANYDENGMFGEDITYIGFPTDSGRGSVLEADAGNLFVLSAKSSELEGAWQFVRQYLLPEYQSTLEWNFPVVKEYVKKNIELAMEDPFYLDENGNKVTTENSVYINGEVIPFGNMTQAQADKLMTFLESIDKRAYVNEDVTAIVEEEAAAFFEGQKSAADVAAIIQNRVWIYVNENS